MSIFETRDPVKLDADQGATRIKRIFSQTFLQIENTLGQVRRIMDRHGVDQINTALGNDRVEAANLYRALKDLVEQHKPNSNIPEMPK